VRAVNGKRFLGAVGIAAVLLGGLALGGSASARSLGVVPLVEHWDGTAWTQVAVPSGSVALSAVVAPSATDVWAFGSSHTAVHWNGTSWQRVSLPLPKGSGFGELVAAAATSPDNIWAVGDVSPLHGPTQALIDHWNGRRWTNVPGPPKNRYPLSGVAALSATNVWAVGETGVTTSTGGGLHTLTIHWNGKTWKRVPSPSPTAASSANFTDTLAAVAGTSASNVWAVGQYDPDANGIRGSRSLVLHWNGSRWKQVPTPDALTPGHASELSGVAAPTATGVWAVGTVNRHGGGHALAELWNGAHWRIVHTVGQPLTAVSALDAADAWAAGGRDSGGDVMHWSGSAWTVGTKLNNRRGLLSVAEISPTDVWAVGGLVKH
jgi:hypothetical protein